MSRRNDINEVEFTVACNESMTMVQACAKLGMHFNTFKRYALQFGCYKPNKSNKGIKTGWKVTRVKTEDILAGKCPAYQASKLRARLLEEGYKQHRCEICGLSEWLGKPIPLELHHKDGNSRNHLLENLQVVCLNCHAQTSTFRSKNSKTR